VPVGIHALCAESPEESFDGVSRESLGAYLRGPGAEVGKRKAAESVELHEIAIKAAKSAVLDRRVEGIKFEIAKVRASHRSRAVARSEGGRYPRTDRREGIAAVSPETFRPGKISHAFLDSCIAQIKSGR